MKISNEQKILLDRYASLINEYNKVMNLTGIDDYQGIYDKHYYDAFQVSILINKYNAEKIADVGTGMGVPGIVLAILNKDKCFYLIEPMKKRCDFLNIVVKELELDNVTIINERSELLDLNCDVVVNRAVAKLNILCEICYNIIREQGLLIAMKSKQLDEELNDASVALKTLNYELVHVQKYNLEVDNSERNNVVLKLLKKNNKFPREFKEIKKNPL